MSDSLQPYGLYSAWNSPGQNTGVGSLPSPGDLPNPDIEPRSPPALQVDFLPAGPQGKPNNTGVDRLSLLQQIFPTQELNWKIPWRRERLPTPVFWSGEFHGLYSSWGRKESDTTE